MPKLEKLPVLSGWACVFVLSSFLLAATAQETKPPAKVPADGGNPAPAAPGLRATPPKVVDVTDPNTPNVPQSPLPQQPLPETTPLYIPDIGSPVPSLIPVPMPASAGPTKPPLERVYRVGKLVIKYGTNVRERNPKLPTEEELANAPVSLLELRGTLYHAAKKSPSGARPSTAGSSPAPTAEQGEPAGRTDVDPALHPRSVAPTAPQTSTPGKPGAKPADQPGKKTDSTPDKKIPKAIPKPIAPEDTPKTFKVSDFGEPRWVSAMALLDVYDSVVKQLTDRGLIGVYLMAAVEPRSGQDLRAGVPDIEIRVFVSEVAKIRTIARRLPFRVGDLPKINDDDAPDGQVVKDPKHLWIKAKSPIFVFNQKKGGGLLEKRRLQDYLSRLNRFPGRRVDAAINSTGETGKVMLDYLVREQKPFMIYAQETNNGVKSTGEWRSRVGLEYRQLANMDDILRLEYVTTDLERFNSGILSYQFALDKPDVLKMRIYGFYGDYTAEDVGFAGATFKGDSLTAGAAIIWTPLYWHGFPLDITLGAEFLRTTVDNQASGLKASGNFILPYVGIGTERTTDRYSFATNWQVKGSFDGPDQDTLNGLGRFDTDGEFLFLNGDIAASIFLEPLILGKKWGDVGSNGENWRRGILANEIALSVHSQYALGDSRLTPQLELIAGGFNTVRGYPESFTAGDSGFVSSFEYRLHVPRLFKPSDATSAKKKANQDAEAANTARTVATEKKPQPKPGEKPGASRETPPVQSAVGERGDKFWQNFRVRPGTAGTGADWDLIFRLFADYGQTFNNRKVDVIETDRTLLSAGAGLEFQIFKPLYMTVRVDYGFVLQGQSELLVDPIDVGDSRLHISATIAW